MPGRRPAVSVPRSALAVLRRLACLLEAVLLRFLLARVASEVPALLERVAQLGLHLDQPSGDAQAERTGLVSRVVPAGELLDEAIKVGERIAGMSLPMVMLAKESVNRAYETTLAEGILFERRLFQATFASEDQKEGMAAFVEKRQPDFTNR